MGMEEPEIMNSYDVLPEGIGKILAKSGEFIRRVPDLKYLSSYWKEFGSMSKFEVFLEDGDYTDILLTTKSGNRVVGAKLNTAHGNMILLPPIPNETEKFSYHDFDLNEEVWSDEGVEFGKRLVMSLIELDKAVRSLQESTPPPDWVLETHYQLERETVINSELETIDFGD